MKKFFLFKNVLVALAITTLAQPTLLAQSGVSPYYKAPDSLSGKTVIIPAGTSFEGRIESTIGSSVSKQGESFTITISSPLLANGTDVLVPSGAQVLGEVVQAIPANSVPHKKKEKPTGKLRVQITALKMPDGMTYPMVASLIGEEAVSGSMFGNSFGLKPMPGRGTGVAYVGTPTGFESITPGKARYNRNGAPSVVTRNELLNDPIMGSDKGISNEKTDIRSLVKKKRNLYIYSGSPLTIRLEAPFKMGIGSSAGQASTLDLAIPGHIPSSENKQAPQLQPGAQYNSQPALPYRSPSLPQVNSQQTYPSQPQSNNSVLNAPRIPAGNNQDSNF